MGEFFAQGKVCTVNGLLAAEGLVFKPHNSFPGVFVKTLVSGESTAGQISCHLVKVEASCRLDDHSHKESLEIHEVVSGSAVCSLGDREFVYDKGSVGVIPAGVVHKVVAGDEGVYILAKFTPALG